MSNMIQTAVAWKLAIFKCCVGAFIIMATTVDTGLATAEICSPHTAKVIIFFTGILIVGLKAIDMFVDQTVNNLKRSADPLGINTDYIKREDTIQKA